MIENFIETKSWRKILEKLKEKVGIFIGTKTIFNLRKKTNEEVISFKKDGRSCWSKNIFDECFNDNKPRGINNKFYEWWSTDDCT